MTQTATVKPVEFLVKSVLSADMIILRGRPVQGPPPELLATLDGITCPRMSSSSKSFQPEPFAWECREYVRKWLVGQKVQVTTRFTLPSSTPTSQKERVTLLANPPSTSKLSGSSEPVDVALHLLQHGYAKLNAGFPKSDSKYQVYLDAENAAKNTNLGMWAAKQAEIPLFQQEVDGNIIQSVWKDYAGKELSGIVEYVKDGATMKILFLNPLNRYLMVQLTGLKCPTFKKSSDPSAAAVPEPFADEAKFFAESRLLQRDIKIIINAVSFPNLCCTVIHPAGYIQEALLSEGLSETLDWGLKAIKDPTLANRLKAAEMSAKEKRLRLWKGLASIDVAKKSDAKLEAFKVTRIINGEMLLLADKQGQERKITLADIRQPKLVKGSTPSGQPDLNVEIGYNHACREFLRSKLIGKEVQVRTDYVRPASDGFDARECCSVYLPNHRSIAEMLVTAGLAYVQRHRADDPHRSADYESLLMAEQAAIVEEKGVHSKDELPHVRLNDASETASKAQTFLPSLQRTKRHVAIVDYVINAARLRLSLPKQSCRLTFALSGLQVPKAPKVGSPEPFAKESQNFVNISLLQHQVEVEIDSVDKSGAFLGSIFYSDGTKNLGQVLLENGFARRYGLAAERSAYAKVLKDAEDHAKSSSLGIWSLQDALMEENAKVEPAVDFDSLASLSLMDNIPRELVISSVEAPSRFYIQYLTPEIRKLQALMDKLQGAAEDAWSSQNASKGVLSAVKLTPSDYVAVKSSVDGAWYRGKIQKYNPSSASYSVLFPDYGNMEPDVKTILKIDTATFGPQLDHELHALPWQAVPARLAFVEFPPANNEFYEDGALAFYDFLKESSNSAQFTLKGSELAPAHSNQPVQVDLIRCAKRLDGAPGFQKPSPASTVDVHLSAELLRKGLVYLPRKLKLAFERAISQELPSDRHHAKGCDYRQTLISAQEVARFNHLGLWMYGDLAIEDDPDC